MKKLLSLYLTEGGLRKKYTVEANVKHTLRNQGVLFLRAIATECNCPTTIILTQK